MNRHILMALREFSQSPLWPANPAYRGRERSFRSLSSCVLWQKSKDNNLLVLLFEPFFTQVSGSGYRPPLILSSSFPLVMSVSMSNLHVFSDPQSISFLSCVCFCRVVSFLYGGSNGHPGFLGYVKSLVMLRTLTLGYILYMNSSLRVLILYRFSS